MSTTFFIQGFLTCFYFFIKTRFNVFFYSWGQRFLHLWYILETSNWQNLHYNHYSFFLQVGLNSIANFDGGAMGGFAPLTSPLALSLLSLLCGNRTRRSTVQRSLTTLNPCGAWWLCGRLGALRPKVTCSNPDLAPT